MLLWNGDKPIAAKRPTLWEIVRGKPRDWLLAALATGGVLLFLRAF